MARYLGGNSLRVRVVAGTHAILMALDADDRIREGLRGFAFWRETPEVAGSVGKWLRASKVFRSVEPSPKNKVDGKYKEFRTNEHPIQSFLWSDYGAEHDTLYRFRIVPMYGDPGALIPSDSDAVSFDIRTEKEDDGKHGIWFNRGAIASQYFARDFENVAPSDAELNDPSNKFTKWLSRGLLEACVGFIDGAKGGEKIRACLYEFTYEPILLAFKAAVEREVDVQIIYHKTKKNDDAIVKHGVPRKTGAKPVLIERTKPKIPHNKFIVRLDGNDKPIGVWTGSTNITPSGFCGQSNVGHLVHDIGVARSFLEYWTLISGNPTLSPAAIGSEQISPHPKELTSANSVTPIFSPREGEAMLFWYGNRMLDAASGVFFTAAFDVSPRLWDPIGSPRNVMRFVLMEDPPKAELKKKVISRDLHVRVSYGAVLGQKRIRLYPGDGKEGGVKSIDLETFPLEKWFWREEHFRKAGNIFFIHTKYLLIDPLGEDPAIFTGSANFSNNSLVNNDENMLLIRGDKRVADIYLTEYDRLFRHFISRNLANENADKPGADDFGSLEERPGVDWTASHFDHTRPNSWRRQMFFSEPTDRWTTSAQARPQTESLEQAATALAAEKLAKKKSAKSAVSKATGKKFVAKTKTAAKKTAKVTAAPAKNSKSTAKKPQKAAAKKKGSQKARISKK